MELLSNELKNYLETTCDPETKLLKRIDRETNLKVSMPRMLSGHYQGRVLSMLSKLLGPRRILEVGTFTGYASLCLAEGLSPDGILYTIDINAELEDMVRANFRESALGAKINYLVGNATEIIPNLDEVFDLVFIDADKKNNETYYNLCIDKLRSGGLIIVDNVLWSGKVLENIKTDSSTALIGSFNDFIASDERVEKLILPVRDGLYMIRKK
ncbi:MAG: O-methyltransferase [Bacteroidetes bacterium]|nr:O-methyltransferase [Bacteroidota bacterium]